MNSNSEASETRPSGGIIFDNGGRVVIVTGGCSGIGKAICENFARSGATVVCADVDTAGGRNLPEGVEFFKCDTSRKEDCDTVVDWTVERFGGLDVLVNNAAVQPKESYRPIHELPAAVWDRVVAVNLSGYTFMAMSALRHMQQQRSGVVVNISSGQGHRTARQVGTYGPVKAANIMQARQWAVEYARDGIRVVSVSPGAIDTPLVRASLAQQGGGEALANRHPVGRIGQPEEVASAVLWISGPGASFVTGTDLEVDGGLGALGSFADPYPMPNAATS
ncbi:MAG: SDR family NAD(P)-dependent oxidoreductase [Fuerstiella sp.]|jgi:NAD(P)-dependent dehydrogenase (short-subunit alcohol dehydrogenase family)|nr:SDR family NAD(P)-dependent oxidoreductase [Fuerstiella sp.]